MYHSHFLFLVFSVCEPRGYLALKLLPFSLIPANLPDCNNSIQILPDNFPISKKVNSTMMSSAFLPYFLPIY